MQVLESTDKITPKSVLRHRPIGTSKPPREKTVSTHASTPTKVSGVTPVVKRASRSSHPGSTSSIPATSADHQKDIPQWQRAEQLEEAKMKAHEENENDGDVRPTRALPIQPKRTSYRSSPGVKPLSTPTRVKRIQTRTKLTQKHAQQTHPLLYLGIGMLSMVVLWTLLTGVIHWTNVTLDDLRYGRPRTAQYDVVLGHNDSVTNPSHLIAINLHRRIEVIEFPGGDPSRAHIYMGPQLYGVDDDLTPATLSFVDVNGDHKLDMVINVQGSHFIFINDKGTFRQPLPSERRQIDQFLRKS